MMGAHEDLAVDLHAASTEDGVTALAVASGRVVITATPAVSIEGRTVVIVRDPEDDDEDGQPSGWYTFDLDHGDSFPAVSWWNNAAHIHHYAAQLAEENGQSDVLWDTVAMIVEKAEAD